MYMLVNFYNTQLIFRAIEKVLYSGSFGVVDREIEEST